MNKLIKITNLFYLTVISLVLLLPLSSCSEEEMYFSVDKIEGDINTGKQIPVSNYLTVKVGYFRINVQNAKGNITASSSNPKVAEVVDIYQAQFRHPEITLNLLRPGEAIIKVKDKDGNTANLYLTVTPIYE